MPPMLPRAMALHGTGDDNTATVAPELTSPITPELDHLLAAACLPGSPVSRAYPALCAATTAEVPAPGTIPHP